MCVDGYCYGFDPEICTNELIPILKSSSSGSFASSSNSGSNGSGGSSDSSDPGTGGSNNSSSSKSAYSSSSQQTTIAKHNEPGPNAVYTATDCFSSGLDNMQPGKCYGINPDRAPHYGWINNNASDTWWWVERACDCSALAEPVTPGGCKYNKQGANVVYTVDDCFSDGLDYMESGKCYSINPDRAPHYGWMNNNAQDRWWWREVECEGEDEDEEIEWELMQCSGSGFGFLGKKSFAGENYNSKEIVSYDSYEAWGKNTKFFYDALGRKTQAHPETRRYLFAPKKKYNEERNSRYLLKTIDGFVEADHTYYMGLCTEREDGSAVGNDIACLPSTPIMGNLVIPLSFRTKIKNPEYQNDSLLKIHEDKHVEIYDSLGNGDWKETIKIDLCKNRTRKAIAKFCPEMRKIAKSKFEEQLTILINAQNKWDDDDKNNVSNHRIDLQKKINEMRLDVDKIKCPPKLL
jgi:hypothetical protein